jgi:FkbM family methyltransferase
MDYLLKEFKNLKFYVRPGASDEKTLKEVVEKHAYEKKSFRISPGENWLDLGGNIGAFTVLAASRNCQVTTYEPDPQNIMMIKKNLALNNLQANIKSRAIVHNDQVSATLNLWPEGQSWRNSLIRNRRGTQPMTVLCENFFKVAAADHCIKMDIEGSEIPILENWPKGFKVKKLVFEYSFDVDPSVIRLRNILDKLRPAFKTLTYSSQIDKIDSWNFFPPCTMVFCSNDSD